MSITDLLHNHLLVNALYAWLAAQNAGDFAAWRAAVEIGLACVHRGRIGAAIGVATALTLGLWQQNIDCIKVG